MLNVTRAMTVTVTVEVDGATLTRTTKHAVGPASAPVPMAAEGAVVESAEWMRAALTGPHDG